MLVHILKIKWHLVCKFDRMKNIFFHCFSFFMHMHLLSTERVYVMYVVLKLMVIGPKFQVKYRKLCKMCIVELHYFFMILHVWLFWFLCSVWLYFAFRFISLIHVDYVTSFRVAPITLGWFHDWLWWWLGANGTNCRWGSVAFIWGEFHRECSWYLLLI